MVHIIKVINSKFIIVRICTSENYVQKLIIKYCNS